MDTKIYTKDGIFIVLNIRITFGTIFVYLHLAETYT